MTPVAKLLNATAAAVFLAASAAVTAADAKLPPVDEAAGDVSWVRFKNRLLESIVRRDGKFVTGIVAPRIRNFTDKDGITEFRKLWEPQSASSPLWVELPKILFLGGAFVKHEKGVIEFCAPYVHFKWPEQAPADVDGAITARETLLKAKPSAASATVLALSYDLVKVLDWEVADESGDGKQHWVKIQTTAGPGFVPEEHIRSPLEYRACFAKSGAAWRLTALEVGE